MRAVCSGLKGSCFSVTESLEKGQSGIKEITGVQEAALLPPGLDQRQPQPVMQTREGVWLRPIGRKTLKFFDYQKSLMTGSGPGCANTRLPYPKLKPKVTQHDLFNSMSAEPHWGLNTAILLLATKILRFPSKFKCTVSTISFKAMVSNRGDHKLRQSMLGTRVDYGLGQQSLCTRTSR